MEALPKFDMNFILDFDTSLSLQTKRKTNKKNSGIFDFG